MSRSEAAKARGQTGFLKPYRDYFIYVIHPTSGAESVAHSGYVKKDAWRAARRWIKNVQGEGYWKGGNVVFKIAGRRVPNHLIAANLHAPKGL